MKSKAHHFAWSLVLIIYTVIAVVAFVFSIRPLLYFLAVPWSVIATFVALLIAHAGGPNAMNRTLFFCTALNILLIAYVAYRPRKRL